MTKEEVLRMAEEAGIEFIRGWYSCVDENLERFASLVAEYATRPKVCCQDFATCEEWTCLPRARYREREACAKVCDELAARDKLSNYYAVAARAIGERNET